ncbi:hypothetical protein EOL70_12335 [Leucothrix sargassi]|nr:hypothetical protein EOL70_12335 [Leucothrix sargassi]
MKKIQVLDIRRMPLKTQFKHPVKHFALAATLCLATSLTSVAFADDNFKGTVKARGTLSAIVNKNYIDANVSRNQIMVAILAANPTAFKGGNINYMLGGEDLRLPTEATIKNISESDARSLLATHNQFFRKGQTGNLTVPSFISLTNSTDVETLVKEKQAQDEKLNSLEGERAKLRDLVARLEQEKAQRDTDLQALEERIQNLQSSSDSLGSTTADLKLKLANGELTGEGAQLLESLQDKNESLNAQLQSARSEMAESTRMEISLERRMLDIQQENALLAEALKAKGVSPADIKAQLDAKRAQDEASIAAAPTAVTAPTQTAAPQVTAPVAPVTETSGSALKWLWLLLPILGLIALAALLWKLFAGKKKKPKQRVQQPAQMDAFADYNRPIDPAAEIEQEPPLEVSIKMDVARAYIEAGDFENARLMLNEVMDEGNTQQILEAQEILGQIPS